VVDRHRGRSLRSRLATSVVELVTPRYLRRMTDSGFGPELAAAMARFEELAARRPPPAGTRTEAARIPVEGGTIGAEWVYGPGVGHRRRPVLLYLHGGGWFFGGLNTHRRMVARLSEAAGIPALAVDYRMVPAVTLGEVLADCLAAYRWLLDRGVPAGEVVIAGDSAGGHLTLATALGARRAGLPAPAALVGLSGVYDLDSAARAAHVNAVGDPAGMAALDLLLSGVLDGADPFDPALSPVRADLAGLPPVLLTAGSSEVLCSDAEELARLLAAAGVRCTLQVWERQVHVFQAFGRLVPESRRSVEDIGAFVRQSVR
jgi:epsilon-lactone hydrolase